MMEWKKLLSQKRLLRNDVIKQSGRNQFQVDIDRIVFSAALRRLAHKTQVHPLSDNDHVHTRLTHSVEVSSVGRSLGTIVGTKIAKRLKDKNISCDTFGYVVQAACLAHDIGNPPFGHSGEDSICRWFEENIREKHKFYDGLSETQINDLKNFEGNAQGFRILTQLENYRWEGGLQLTYAVLGTFTKYPHSSAVHPLKHDKYIGGKKIGFFNSEREHFSTIARELGLMAREQAPDYWCRHPLAFLVEAADDICYAIIDIEDGYLLGYLSFKEAEALLKPIADGIVIGSLIEEREKIGKLRAVAIGNLITKVADVFIENEKSLLAGKFQDDLIKHTKYAEHVAAAKRQANEKIYYSERKTKIEIAASKIISGLLEVTVPVVADLEKVNWNPKKLRPLAQKIARLIPFQGVTTRYDGLLRVTDFISGMTDRYALDLYRKLNGISI